MVWIIEIVISAALIYYLNKDSTYKTKKIYYKYSISILLLIFLGVAGYLSFIKFGYQYSFYSYFALTGLLGLMACIDILTYHIPDELLVLSGIIGLILLIVNPNVVWYINILGAIITILIWWILSKILKAGMGSGDGYSLALITLFLGWEQTFIVFLSALVLSGIVGMLLIMLKKGTKKTALPFLPFLAIVQILVLII